MGEVGEVLPYGAGEHVGLLRQEGPPRVRPPRVRCPAGGRAGDEHGARVGWEHAREQGGERGLADAARTDDGEVFPRPHDQVEGVEDGRRAAAVGEGDTAELRRRGGRGTARPAGCGFASPAAVSETPGVGGGAGSQKRSRTTSRRVPAEPSAVMAELRAGSRACTRYVRPPASTPAVMPCASSQGAATSSAIAGSRPAVPSARVRRAAQRASLRASRSWAAISGSTRARAAV